MVRPSGASPAAPTSNLVYFTHVPGIEQILRMFNRKYHHLMVIGHHMALKMGAEKHSGEKCAACAAQL